jgi:hypothetical protein
VQIDCAGLVCQYAGRDFHHGGEKLLNVKIFTVAISESRREHSPDSAGGGSLFSAAVCLCGGLKCPESFTPEAAGKPILGHLIADVNTQNAMWNYQDCRAWSSAGAFMCQT